MDKTLASDIPSDDKAIALAIDDTSAEIDQVIEHMRKDQADLMKSTESATHHRLGRLKADPEHLAGRGTFR